MKFKSYLILHCPLANFLFIFLKKTSSQREQSSTKSSNIINNFIGCLQLITLNNRDPFLYFDQGSRRVQVNPSGTKISRCDADAVTPSPVSLDSSSLLYINHTYLNATLTRNDVFVVQFSFRTFSKSGMVLQVKGDQNLFHTIGLRLVLRSGKLICFLWHKYDATTIDLESPTEVSDGDWHAVEVKVLPSLLALTVNRMVHKTITLAPREVRALKKNDVRFGGGFVGCLNHVMLHQQSTGFDDLLNSGMVVRKNIRKGCNLINHCFPDPCLNGGLCYQVRNKGRCDCTGTEFHGPYCETSLYKTSCAAYQRFGLSETSYCLVDPDGAGPIQPYTNLCRLLPEIRQIATIVNHDKRYFVDGSRGDTKFLNSIFHLYKYELDTKSLVHLIKISKTCRQRVSFKCLRTGLFDPPNMSWLSNSGNERSYWGNVSSFLSTAPSQFPTCECGLTRSCLDPSKMCNCDSLNESWSEDSGYITNKKDLPVRRVTLSNAVSEKQSSIYIGPLECFGEIDVSNGEPSVRGSGRSGDLWFDADDTRSGNKALSFISGGYKTMFIEDRDILSRVCFSVRVKEQMIKAANDSVRVKLHSEEPLPSPRTTRSTDNVDSGGGGGSITGTKRQTCTIYVFNISIYILYI